MRSEKELRESLLKMQQHRKVLIKTILVELARTTVSHVPGVFPVSNFKSVTIMKEIQDLDKHITILQWVLL